MKDLGYLTSNPAVWYGYVVPASTPKEVVDRLYDAFNKAAHDPAVQERLREVQFIVNVRSPAEFGKFMQVEAGRARRIIEDNQIQLD